MTPIDLSPERLARTREWCSTRIDEKPWFKEFPGKPDAVVDCHFLIAIIDEINRLRTAESLLTAPSHGRDAGEVATDCVAGLWTKYPRDFETVKGRITTAILSERAEAERLRKVLEPFAAEATRFAGSSENYRYKPDKHSRLSVAAFRDAARALSPSPAGKEQANG